jgi:CubicO group peptidase (beta-lactamase class C family)
MGNDVRSACDGILQRVTTGRVRVPGVVPMITDRSANIYEGAAGARVLGSDQAMTLDSVFAIFSTTKPIAGTAVLQCVEDGKLDLDLPAKTYVPDNRVDGHLEATNAVQQRALMMSLRPPVRAGLANPQLRIESRAIE